MTGSGLGRYAETGHPRVSAGTGKTIFSCGNNDGIMNEIQYVYDAGGHKKSVIVPVEVWERTLQVQKPRLAPCNPQDYYGIYRDRIKNPQDVARALRSEWNRE
jgi:hypothetical protein